jgi:hypothetical protein
VIAQPATTANVWHEHEPTHDERRPLEAFELAHDLGAMRVALFNFCDRMSIGSLRADLKANPP